MVVKPAEAGKVRFRITVWRKEWDSNPRYSHPYSDFQVQFLVYHLVPPDTFSFRSAESPHRISRLPSSFATPGPSKYVSVMVSRIHGWHMYRYGEGHW